MATTEILGSPHEEIEQIGHLAVEADGEVQSPTIDMTPFEQSLKIDQFLDNAEDELDAMKRKAVSVSIHRLHENPNDPDAKLKFKDDALEYLNYDPHELSTRNKNKIAV